MNETLPSRRLECAARVLLPLRLRRAALPDGLDARVRRRVRHLGAGGRDACSPPTWAASRPARRWRGASRCASAGPCWSTACSSSASRSPRSRCRSRSAPPPRSRSRCSAGARCPADAGGLASALFYLAVRRSRSCWCRPRFMGATLPLLARHAVRSDREIGPRIGTLYAVNTAGAIGGTLVCGFVLLPALGLRGTVWVGRRAQRARVRRWPRSLARASRAPSSRSAATRRRGRAVRLPRAPGSCRSRCSRAPCRSPTKCCGRACSATCSAAASTPSRRCSRASSSASRSAARSARASRRARARAARGFAMAQVARRDPRDARLPRDRPGARLRAAHRRRLVGGPASRNAALAMLVLVPPALCDRRDLPVRGARARARTGGREPRERARLRVEHRRRDHRLDRRRLLRAARARLRRDARRGGRHEPRAGGAWHRCSRRGARVLAGSPSAPRCSRSPGPPSRGACCARRRSRVRARAVT